jgi:four helix bundle protein
MEKGRVGAAHFADQMLRSATNARSHYAEARGSESPQDFIHKIGMGLKELRETQTWLDDALEGGYVDRATTERLLQEVDELIAIFYASRKTAKKNLDDDE